MKRSEPKLSKLEIILPSVSRISNVLIASARLMTDLNRSFNKCLSLSLSKVYAIGSLSKFNTVISRDTSFSTLIAATSLKRVSFKSALSRKAECSLITTSANIISAGTKPTSPISPYQEYFRDNLIIIVKIFYSVSGGHCLVYKPGIYKGSQVLRRFFPETHNV